MTLGEECCQGSLLQFFTLLGAKGISKPFSFATMVMFFGLELNDVTFV